MAGCGADTASNSLFTTLLSGESFPDVTIDFDSDLFKLPSTTASELYQPVTKLNDDDLTTGVVDGTGTFDKVMKSYAAHLRKEYEANRISGAEYTKAFIALSESAMSNSVQFLLGKDQAFWAAQQAQILAVTARVQLQAAVVELARIKAQAKTAQAEFALTKMKIATEDAQYCILLSQNIGAKLQNDTATYNLANILPAQKASLEAQTGVAREQMEVARAQTMNNRSDNATTVTGLIGKQKDLSDQQKALYGQQIISYQRDSQLKAAKLFTDAWITQKTIDEGLSPPSNFQNSSLDSILSNIKSTNGF